MGENVLEGEDEVYSDESSSSDSDDFSDCQVVPIDNTVNIKPTAVIEQQCCRRGNLYSSI